ncbi:MAG: CooT family nickel-binding protein [Methanocellales archaeon]
MCESTVILKKGSKREVVMKDVIQVLVKGEDIEVIGILGDSKNLRGSIAKIDLSGHEIIIEGR